MKLYKKFEKAFGHKVGLPKKFVSYDCFGCVYNFEMFDNSIRVNGVRHFDFIIDEDQQTILFTAEQRIGGYGYIYKDCFSMIANGNGKVVPQVVLTHQQFSDVKLFETKVQDKKIVGRYFVFNGKSTHEYRIENEETGHVEIWHIAEPSKIQFKKIYNFKKPVSDSDYSELVWFMCEPSNEIKL